MKTKKLLRAVIILFVLAFNIGCDQVSKSIVRKKLYIYDPIGYWHNHFTFIRTENTGAFLSLGDSLPGPLKMILFNILPLLAVVFGLVYILIKTNISRFSLLGIIMIIGGGIGNIYDRILYGSVTDFMHISFSFFQTGVFNVADMSIMAGTFMILIHAWFSKKKEGETASENTELN
jgi:signal peptidase II